MVTKRKCFSEKKNCKNGKPGKGDQYTVVFNNYFLADQILFIQ